MSMLGFVAEQWMMISLIFLITFWFSFPRSHAVNNADYTGQYGHGPGGMLKGCIGASKADAREIN
jgi:hypothetical protein